MAAKKQNSDVEKIEPGMVVEVTEGDLGEKDVSKPKVVDVVEDQNGNIEKVVVSIGNSRKIMRNQPLGLITNICLVVTVLISVAAATLLFYGLATGQGG